LRGFYFEKININFPKDCVGLENFDLKILTIFTKRSGIKNGLDEYLERCQKNFSKIFKIQLSQVNKSPDALEKIVTVLPAEVNKEKIKEIYYSEGLKNNQLPLLEFFIKVINQEKDKIGRRVLILETIKNQPDSLWKYLLELSVALESDNQAWSKKIAIKIINMGPKEPSFPRAIESLELTNKLGPSLKKFLDTVKVKLKDKMLKKMLVNQLVNLAPTENLQDELPFWSADWTLSDMRGFLDSKNYGKPFIGFWFMELISATHEAEVMRFLAEVLDEEVVKKYGKSYSWLLTFNALPALETQIITIFKDLWESGESYNRYLVLELLENSKIKELMAKDIPELSKPLFQLKRALFFNMLKRGENLNFSIYQLLKLGDRSDELLWWASLYGK
jgi:hypothetical protein